MSWFNRVPLRPLFLAVFLVYLYFVLDYTLFQYQSLLVMRLFNPHLMLNGFAEGEAVNLLPLVGLTTEDLKTSLLNILMLMPFGFGLPFVSRLRGVKVILAGAALSLAIELLQFTTGRLAGITFRVADINDLLFNTLGAVLGYAGFVGFRRAVRWLLPA